MEEHLNIKEIAELFNIPVSTLHFWEKMGLFHIQRNKENRYREFYFSDTLNIWEIMLYRDLDIPVQEVKEILKKDIDNLDHVYAENELKIEQEMRDLKKKRVKIRQQRELIQMVKQLEEEPYKHSKPDFAICKVDHGKKDTIKEALDNPYNSIMYVETGEAPKYTRGMNMEINEDDEILWKESEGEYIEFLLKMNLHDPSDNNLEKVSADLHAKGYVTGNIIARYLLVATEEEKRTEFYRAWVKVSQE